MKHIIMFLAAIIAAASVSSAGGPARAWRDGCRTGDASSGRIICQEPDNDQRSDDGACDAQNDKCDRDTYDTGITSSAPGTSAGKTTEKTAKPSTEASSKPVTKPATETSAKPVTKPATTAPAPELGEITTSRKDEPNTDYDQAYADEVIRLVNIERAKYGLTALTKNDKATLAADLRAKEIPSYFSHTRPDGRSCFTAAGDVGLSYRSAGENIAYGQRSPEEVVRAWMNSEGHRANILSSNFKEIGVSCYSQRGVLYWAQFFIG